MIDKLFVATKAFIVQGGKILLLRESNKYVDGTNCGRWDFPGGRLKIGEHFEENLAREVKEETGLSVSIGHPLFVGEWRPKVKGEQWQIIGIFFECFADDDCVKLSEDHDAFVWITPDEYKKYDLLSPNDKVFEVYWEQK